jgi:hypothetical protein
MHYSLSLVGKTIIVYHALTRVLGNDKRFSGELPGGGSREQKDIFQDILLDLQRQIGATAAVIELAQRRLQRNPNHFQALAALAWAYGQSGDTAQQQYIYQDIVRRAGLMPISDQAPALVEARAALQTM